MIREYTPAHHSFDSGVIAGAVDNDHESPCEAAAHEMEEEAHLIGDETTQLSPINMQQLTNTTLQCIYTSVGGKWIPLLNSPTGTDKYSETRSVLFYSYV